MFSCGIRENIYLMLQRKPLAMRRGYSAWQWENFKNNHKVVHSKLTNTGFMSHAKILLP